MTKGILWGLAAIIVLAAGSFFLFTTAGIAPEPAAEHGHVATIPEGAEENTAATASLPAATSSPAPAEPAPAAPPATKPAVKSFTVTGSNFSFSPATLRVNQGDTVRITFVNADGKHDLRLDAFGAATAVLDAGGRQTIQFTASRVGQFEYYCSVGNHRAMGMRGTLIVQ